VSNASNVRTTLVLAIVGACLVLAVGRGSHPRPAQAEPTGVTLLGWNICVALGVAGVTFDAEQAQYVFGCHDAGSEGADVFTHTLLHGGLPVENAVAIATISQRDGRDDKFTLPSADFQSCNSVDEDQDFDYDEDPDGDQNGDGAPGVAGVDDDSDGAADLSDSDILDADYDDDDIELTGPDQVIGGGDDDPQDIALAADDDDEDGSVDEDGTDSIKDDVSELVCELDARDGALDGLFSLGPEDFAGINLDANQLHDEDGILAAIAFVDDDGPVIFDVPRHGGALQISDVGNPSRWTCNTLAEDADCDGDPSTEGDGVVANGITADALGVERGVRTLLVAQEGLGWEEDYTVVGEPDEIEFFVLEETLAAGLSAAECPLAGDVAGFTEALGRPEKTVLIARALDDDGTQVTGGFMYWTSEDDDILIPASNVTPTLDLGGFGLGAPMIACGTNGPGVVDLTVELLDANAQLEQVTDILVLDADTESDTDFVTYTVVGEPAAMTFAATPSPANCDGVTGVQLAVTLTDTNGAPVLDGTEVAFDIQVLGTLSPTVAKTVGGVATTTVTPLLGATAGVTVTVSAGVLTQQTLVVCGAGAPGAQPPAPPGGGGQPGGSISGPDTGAGSAPRATAEERTLLWIVAAVGAVLTIAGGAIRTRLSR
jgi:hypothetical protein